MNIQADGTESKRMTAKEHLMQIRRIQTRLGAMSEQLTFLRAAAEYASPQLDGMPRPSTPNPHKGEDAIIRVIEMERKLNDEFNHLADINATIEKVSEPQLQSVLVKRYVSGKTWEEIAAELFVSVRTTHRLHDIALAEIEKLAHAGTAWHS